MAFEQDVQAAIFGAGKGLGIAVEKLLDSSHHHPSPEEGVGMQL
jgi:hypothetical protein